MKKSMRFFLGISLLVLLTCYSCGENSEKEMTEAQQAMQKAKSVFAEDLASSDWQNAMQAWEQGQTAVKEGKPAKNHFITAKSRFEKTYGIAKSKGEILSREVRNMQLGITDQLGQIKTALNSGKIGPKIQKEIKPITMELEEGAASVDSLLSQGNYVKAGSLARELQVKLRNVDLIINGKKPTHI